MTHAPLPDFLHKSYAYLYQEEGARYAALTSEEKKDYATSSDDLRYLYLCTFAPTAPTDEALKARDFYLAHLDVARKNLGMGDKARAVLVLTHYQKEAAARAFYQSIKEYSTTDEELGQMFYGGAGTAPEQLLATVIEAAHVMQDSTTIINMQFSLLCLKQTRMWHDNLATANAVHALLLSSPAKMVQGDCAVSIGKQTIRLTGTVGGAEELLGYRKTTIADAKPLTKATFTNSGNTPAWGAIYGECDEDISRVQATSVGKIQIEKRLFVQRIQDGHTAWKALSAGSVLQKGDRILTRLILTTDRDLDFVHVKDDRAACLEPTTQLSGYANGGYQVSKDASTDLFYDRLPRGTRVIELESTVAHSGTYTTGIARAESVYSTAFTGHSTASILHVE
jgi:hypothetical protein